MTTDSSNSEEVSLFTADTKLRKAASFDSCAFPWFYLSCDGKRSRLEFYVTCSSLSESECWLVRRISKSEDESDSLPAELKLFTPPNCGKFAD